QRLLAHRVERHAGRQHQALLRAADRDIDAPLVVAIVGRSKRGDGIDQKQRRMAGGPRWSISGMSMARSTRSGTGVGPGICRKWRTGRREAFCGMSALLQIALRIRTVD